jgi:molecular chaperone GrpE (heat shock protein)
VSAQPTIEELEDEIEKLRKQLKRVLREKDALATARDAMRASASAAAKTAEVAIGRLIEMRDLAEAALKWKNGWGTENIEKLAADLVKYIERYRIRRDQES